MSIYNKLYWLTRLDPMHDFFVTCAVVLLLAASAALTYNLMDRGFDNFHSKERNDDRIRIRKLFSRFAMFFIPIGFIFILCGVFIPTEKEAIFIITGGKTIEWAQQDSSLNRIPGQTTEIISKFMESQINELEEKIQHSESTK